MGIASTWIALSSPSRITEPWPNSRSIWVTAACSAASLAFASLSAPFLEALEERGVVFFSSAMFIITFLRLARRTPKSTRAHRTASRVPPAARTPRPSGAGANGRGSPGRRRRARSSSAGSGPGGRLDAHRAAPSAPPPLGGGALGRLDPGDRHVGPERPLLGLVEALGLEPVGELGLERDRGLVARRVDREQAGAARRNRDRLRFEARSSRAARRSERIDLARSARSPSRAGRRGSRASRAAPRGAIGRSAGSPSASRCQATRPCAHPSGRSSATNNRARGLFSRSFATSPNLRSPRRQRRPVALQIECAAMSAEFPQVEGVEHRFVDANGVRVHVAEAGPERAPPRRADPPPSRLAAALVHVAAGDRRPAGRLPPDRPGPARLRLERGAGPRLRRRDVRRRPGRAARRARDRARVRDRPRLGRLDRGPARPPPPRSGRADAGLQRAASVDASHSQARRRELAQLVHVGDRDARARPVGARSMAGSPSNILSRGNVGTPFTDGSWTPTWTASASAPARSRSATCIATTSAPFARASPGAGATHRLHRAHPIPVRRARPLRVAEAAARLRALRRRHGVELVPDSGHFVVDEKPDLVVERAREFFG